MNLPPEFSEKPKIVKCEFCGVKRNINLAPDCPLCAAKDPETLRKKAEARKYAKINGSKSKYER